MLRGMSYSLFKVCYIDLFVLQLLYSRSVNDMMIYLYLFIFSMFIMMMSVWKKMQQININITGKPDATLDDTLRNVCFELLIHM